MKTLGVSVSGFAAVGSTRWSCGMSIPNSCRAVSTRRRGRSGSSSEETRAPATRRAAAGDLRPRLVDGGRKARLDLRPLGFERLVPVVRKQLEEARSKRLRIVEQELGQLWVAADRHDTAPRPSAHGCVREHPRVAVTAVIPQRAQELERHELRGQLAETRELVLEATAAGERKHEVRRAVDPREAKRVQPA